MKNILLQRLLLCGTALGFCAAPFSAHALPVGGIVSGGSAEIRDAGTHTVVHQGTDRAVIDWQSFDVHSGEQVYFSQPSANAAVLNRIHDTDASRIDGALTANGQVYLVNPNGMVFGKGAQVDAAGLVATTADIGNAAFMQGGRLEFNQPGNPNAAIVNEGSITVKEGGLAALVAPNVSNSGIITAKAGTVALAGEGSTTIDFYGDGLLHFAAPKGTSGIMNASQAAAIVDGVVNSNGVLQADTIEVVGEDIVIGSDAELTANMVHIGGEYQGKGRTPTAGTTTIEKGANIYAEDGEVIVWADKHTQMDGNVHAKGGFVETSGKQTLGILGNVEAKDWLLDPADVNIAAADANIGGNPNFIPTATAATIDTNTIKTALDAGTNVTVTTGGDAFVGNGDITVSSAITTTGAGNLTLSAFRNITVNNSITLSGGDLTLRADNAANNSGYIAINADILTNGGNITAGGGNAAITPGVGFAIGNAGQASGFLLNNMRFDAGGGNVIVNGKGYDVATNSNYGVDIDGSWNGRDIRTSGTGTINITGTGGGTGASTGNYGVNLGHTAVINNGSGTTTITGQGGNPTGTGGNNIGVYGPNWGTIVVNTGAISVTGTGGGGSTSGGGNSGLSFNSYFIDSSGGAISVTGTGGTAKGSNAGVTSGSSAGWQFRNTGSGDVTVTGTGNSTTGANSYGVNLGAGIVGSGGSIAITGTGGAGTGSTNYGVYINTATANVTTSGTGNITIQGTGGGTVGSSSNYGVYLGGGTTIQTTGTGNVNITGQGGNANGTGDSQYGVYIQTTNGIQTANNGTITITGTGGSGTGSGTDNTGIYLSGAVTGSGGAVTITGTGGASTGNTNHGIYVDGATAVISNSGTGGIDVTGTGGGSGASDSNNGIHLDTGAATFKTTGSGNITATATTGTGATSQGVTVALSNGFQTTGTDNITVSADTMTLGAANAINSAGSLTIVPKTANTSIGLGTGTGTLQLSDAELGGLAWGAGSMLTLGNATTGAIDINTGYSFANPLFLQSGTGYNITLNGALTSTYNASGASVTLLSGGNFINNAGATAITTAGAARWLVYSEAPGLDTLGGLTPGFTQFSCTYGSCTLFDTISNGLLYRNTPPPTSPTPPAIAVPVIPPSSEEPLPPVLPATTPPLPPSTIPDPATAGEMPIPQFLLTTFLPNPYVVPAAAEGGTTNANTPSYDGGAPTPGLDTSNSNNLDAQYSEAIRSNHSTPQEQATNGSYGYTPDMLRLLGCKQGAGSNLSGCTDGQ